MVGIDDIPEEHPSWKPKRGKAGSKGPKGTTLRSLLQRIRGHEGSQVGYYKAHQPNFEQEGSYGLCSTFWQMATSTNFLGTEFHEVQESWGWQEGSLSHQLGC